MKKVHSNKYVFTKADLAYIVNAIDISGATYKELGEEFGCSRTTIWRRYKKVKAKLPDTEIARLSEKEKKEYKDREKMYINKSLQETHKEINKEEYKSKYEEQQKWIDKFKGWLKYILIGGDTNRW